MTGRPLTLVRCGSGLTGDCIFMKHSKLWAPPQLERVRIQEKTKVGEYLVIESPDAIVALAQMDILEIHTWNTRQDKVELPDRVVIDLDPGGPPSPMRRGSCDGCSRRSGSRAG